jgi:ribosomal protein S18 acetylase RimI-like enzyme
MSISSSIVKSALTKSVSFHRGTIGDAAELAAFGARTFIETYSGTSSHPDDIQTHVEKSFGLAQQSKELADDSPTTTIIARSSETSHILAYAQVVAPSPLPISSVASLEKTKLSTENPPTMELKRFYVDSQAHGKGIAAMLMEQVFAVAHNNHHEHLWLGVWEENPRAIRYYTKKAGFWQVGTTVFTVGPDKQTDQVLVAAVLPV